MAKLNAEKAATAGDFVWRYMRARHRFKERVASPLPTHALATLIAQGKEEFDEVYIEADATPPVVLDGKAEDFFAAIIKKDYGAMPNWGRALLTAWHLKIFSNGPIPAEPRPRGPIETPERA